MQIHLHEGNAFPSATGSISGNKADLHLVSVKGKNGMPILLLNCHPTRAVQAGELNPHAHITVLPGPVNSIGIGNKTPMEQWQQTTSTEKQEGVQYWSYSVYKNPT